MPRKRTLSFVLALVLGGRCGAGQMRPITAEDCVSTRRVIDQEVRLSPDGSRLAYVVKGPNVSTNANDHQLYIRDVATTDIRAEGRLLVQSDRISGVRWLGTNKLVFRSEKQSASNGALSSNVSTVDVDTGRVERLDLPAEVEHYSASTDGDIVVFSIRVPDVQAVAGAVARQPEERGYAVVFGGGMSESASHLPEDEVFRATKTAAGSFQVSRLEFLDSSTKRTRSTLRDVLELKLSPDGKRLLIKYNKESYPSGWAEQSLVKYTNSFGTSSDTYVLELYDMSTGQSRLAFNYLGGLLHTSWSSDSQAFSVVGPAPFGSDEAKAEFKSAVQSGNILYYMNRFQNVFTVDVQTGKVTRVVQREGGEPGNLKFMEDLPLSWKHKQGPMFVRTGDNSFAWMEMRDGVWKETQHFDLWTGRRFLSGLVSDGNVLVGVAQTWMTPPDLFAYDLPTGRATLLTDLNPEYRNILLGQVEPIQWTNQYGSRCKGFLIKPVGFQAGKKYPMVFLSAPPADVFISDAPYTTAYAPQPLANAGFLVVVSQYPCDNKIPKGRFPGDMRDAYNWMAMVESAVDLLADRGVVDKNKIGIVGFSRTSWLTDFTLTHSSRNFVAASSADSGIYTYGDYFMYNSSVLMRASETQVGGPPYGDALKYWLEYAPPFNAREVKAAVLMEYIDTAAYGLEFFTALRRLGKPVAFYRYPHGAHPLDTPFERVSSLHRNIDWFRFWMQEYERIPLEYDLQQYVQWRKLREQQAWNDMVSREGGNPVTEYLRQTGGEEHGRFPPAPAAHSN